MQNILYRPFNLFEISSTVRRESIIQTIDNTLSSIECLKYSHRYVPDSDADYWTLEYGTMPFQLTLDDQQRMVHQNVQFIPFIIAEAAKRKYPELHDENDDYVNGYPPMPTLTRGWAILNIKLIEKYDRYVLEVFRIDGSGCRNTYFFFIDLMPDIVNASEDYIWKSRHPYLALGSGLTEETEDDTHIMRYVLNDMIIREICTYI